MRVLSYLYFTSPLTFEDWQKEISREIVSVSPIVPTAQMKNAIDTSNRGVPIIGSSTLTYSKGIFVTYWKDSE